MKKFCEIQRKALDNYWTKWYLIQCSMFIHCLIFFLWIQRWPLLSLQYWGGNLCLILDNQTTLLISLETEKIHKSEIDFIVYWFCADTKDWHRPPFTEVTRTLALFNPLRPIWILSEEWLGPSVSAAPAPLWGTWSVRLTEPEPVGEVTDNLNIHSVWIHCTAVFCKAIFQHLCNIGRWASRNLIDFTVHFLSIYVDLMSHHVPGPPGYDAVMTEQVSDSKEPKMLGQHIPSIPTPFI